MIHLANFLAGGIAVLKKYGDKWVYEDFKAGKEIRTSISLT